MLNKHFLAKMNTYLRWTQAQYNTPNPSILPCPDKKQVQMATLQLYGHFKTTWDHLYQKAPYLWKMH